VKSSPPPTRTYPCAARVTCTIEHTVTWLVVGTDTSVIARGYNRMPEIVTQRSRRHPSVTEYILIEGYVELRALLQAPQQCLSLTPKGRQSHADVRNLHRLTRNPQRPSDFMVYCSAKLVASATISNPRADKVTLGDDKPTMTFRFYGLLQRQTRGECNNFQSKGRQSHAG